MHIFPTISSIPTIIQERVRNATMQHLTQIAAVAPRAFKSFGATLCARTPLRRVRTRTYIRKMCMQWCRQSSPEENPARQTRNVLAFVRFVLFFYFFGSFSDTYVCGARCLKESSGCDFVLY